MQCVTPQSSGFAIKRPLRNNSSEPSTLEGTDISPALDSKDPVLGVSTDSIGCSLYPLSDGLPAIDSPPQSMSKTSVEEQVTTSKHVVGLGCELTEDSADCLKTLLSPSAQSAASLVVNDTPVVPGSWYGPGLSSLVNDTAGSYRASHSVSDVLTQTPILTHSLLHNSPLHNEASLNRPPTPRSAAMHDVNHRTDRTLAELTRQYLMPEDRAEEQASNTLEAPLSAGFVEDITAPDGQAFYAGVTFIKVWRMVNNGSRDWPADTEVVFVGGAQLNNGDPLPHAQPIYPVGPLKPGEEKTVWTPELRAPDVPGSYTSYWRLRDGKGQLFGDSIWVDIEVVDPSQSDELVTSSSVIIMPNPICPASPAVDEQTSSRSPTEHEESFDDYLSDFSSVSIVSVPSSEDESDTTLWEASRGHATSSGVHVQADHAAEPSSTAMDYVLIYDDNTSEED
ncbi:hypothetical protein C0992_004992 [Termitomyces sp. T32_za158]|nr:hypothetical protein C0992_004992 [Termitomyces sp. T32_za158]